jgi:hypothetical protein
MPRSGSTLQFQLTAHLVEHAGLGERLEWVPPEGFPRLRIAYAGRARWNVFKTHACTPEIRAEFDANGARGLYVYRDVRDVVVSRMRKRNETFDRIWEDRMMDALLSGFDHWTSIDRVLVSRYEDMIANLPREVERIAAHLGIPMRQEDCERVASLYTIERQRERIRDAEAAGRLAHHGGFHYDPISNLHVDHIRSGRSGEWRHALTPTQVALIEERAKHWLLANGYALSLPSWKRVVLLLRDRRRQRRRRDAETRTGSGGG